LPSEIKPRNIRIEEKIFGAVAQLVRAQNS
jgi:hypothetical protein